MSGFRLDGEDHYLEYEGLHLLCTHCGVYGHRPETCVVKKAQSKQVDEGEVSNKQDSGDKGAPSSTSNVQITEKWTIVQKTRRPRKPKEKKGDLRKGVGSGSRYEVLVEEGEKQEGEVQIPNITSTMAVVVPGRENVGNREWRQLKERKTNRMPEASREVRGERISAHAVNLSRTEVLSEPKRVEKRLREEVPVDRKGDLCANNKMGPLLLTMGTEDEIMDMLTNGGGNVDEDISHVSPSPDMAIDPGDDDSIDVDPGDTYVGPASEDHMSNGIFSGHSPLGSAIPETQMSPHS